MQQNDRYVIVEESANEFGRFGQQSRDDLLGAASFKLQFTIILIRDVFISSTVSASGFVSERSRQTERPGIAIAEHGHFVWKPGHVGDRRTLLCPNFLKFERNPPNYLRNAVCRLRFHNIEREWRQFAATFRHRNLIPGQRDRQLAAPIPSREYTALFGTGSTTGVSGTTLNVFG